VDGVRTAGRRAAAMLAAGLLAGQSAGAALAASMVLVEEHVRWTSFIAEERGEHRFRAMTVDVVDGATVALAFDRYPGGCERLFASLVITIPVPASRSVALMDDPGAMRVDERPIRPIRFNAVAREEESLIVSEITKILGGGDFAAELRRGEVVRFMLGTERQTYYLHFSLRGFAAAADRTLALCRQAEPSLRVPRQPKPGGTADRDYFSE